MTSKTVLRFMYALFWLYAGAIIAVGNGLEGYPVGLGALAGLALGHMLSMVVDVVLHRAGFKSDK